jgi:hypothetical protein
MSRRATQIDRELAQSGVPAVLCQATVAKVLDRAPRTVRKYEAAGLLPSMRPRGRKARPLYLRRDVARFLATQ